MAIAADACIVALLGRDDGARQQLRQALQELGAAVAFEADSKGATASTVLGHQPNVVIVNLEEGADDDIDHLQALFDAPGINVVFNDADVSRNLEGWDLARWARHLAAKVLGHDDTMPPPPEGSSRPSPARSSAAAAASTTVSGVSQAGFAAPRASVVAEIDDHVAVVVDVVEVVQPEPQLDLAAALGLVDAPASVTETSVLTPIELSGLQPVPGLDEPAELPSTVPTVDFPASFEVDVSSIELAMTIDAGTAPERLSTTPEPLASDSFAAEELAEHEIDFDFSFDEASPESAAASDLSAEDSSIAVRSELAPVVGEDPADDFDWDIDNTAASVPDAGLTHADARDDAEDVSLPTLDWSGDQSGEVQGDDPDLLDAEVAALAAQLDAFEVDSADGPKVQDLQFEDVHVPDVPEVVADAQAPTKPAATSSFGELSLNLSGEIQVATPSRVAGSGFDFSKVADLGLEPIDEAASDSVDPLLVAMGLAEAPTLEEFYQAEDGKIAQSSAVASSIPHVVVLGASIGGPDALRSFLAELPQNFPALFLIVQHLESGYFERLAQQLQKATTVPVKLASANMQAKAGEVLVVPANEHFSLETSGRVVFRPHDAPPHYTPSIDAVLRDVADHFGKRATAVIFSGMAGDAVEGAVYLTSKGGEVWAQDPQSCVVSSMVDGAKARGVVEFTGSPRELAARCISRFGV